MRKDRIRLIDANKLNMYEVLLPNGYVGMYVDDNQILSAPTIAELPKNPTNGDVLKAMFPNAEVKHFTNMCGMKSVDINLSSDIYSPHTFSDSWWNSPYQIGEGK